MRVQHWSHLLLLLCCMSFFPIGVSAQSSEDKVIITKSDTEQFPDITLAMHYIDAEGNPVTDLKPEDISIIVDDGEPLSTTVKLDKDQQPVAIAFVIDTSALMTDKSTPERKRFRDMIDQLNNLVNRLPPDSKMALITFNYNEGATTPAPLTTDGGAVRNKIVTLEAELDVPQDKPYPITDAIQLALTELTPASDAARAVFVYAAGAPDSLDEESIRKGLDKLEDNPPSINFLGFGSDGEGQFNKYPAHPSSLETAAKTFGGTFLHFFTEDIANTPNLVDQVDKRYNNFLALKNQYLLTFRAGEVTPGEHTLDVKIRGGQGSVDIEVPAIKPQIKVQVPDEVLKDKVTIKTKVVYTQTPIKKVEYFLNGIPIGESEDGPDFPVEFNAYDKTMQQRYTPGESYNLLAAATDSSDQQSRSEEERVTLAPLPEPTLQEMAMENLPLIGGIALALLLLPLGIYFLRRRNRPPAIVNVNAMDDGGSSGPNLHDSTERFSPPTMTSASTERYTPAPVVTASAPVYMVKVYENDHEQTYKLSGRQSTIGKDPKNTISINNRWVSRNHAVIAITQNGIELTDLDSANGTFVGEGKDRQLKMNMPEEIKNGDVFWIGPEIRAELIEEGA